MAKKHFGKLITFAAIAGAATAGISYFLKYKSFHKELDEDFHDFEEDFDENEFKHTEDNSGGAARSYVSLTPDKKAEAVEEEINEAEKDAESAVDETPEADDSTTTIVEDVIQ